MEKLKETPNRVRIYSYKNPALHSFYISLFVKAGVLYEEPTEYGITHFLEHIAIRSVNASMDGKLYSTLDKFGVEFNASTYSEMVQFYTGGATENFRVGAEVISALLRPLALTRADIDAERKRIKAEIRESDDKNTLASFTNKCVFEGTSLSSSIVGTNSSVDRINLTRLEAYRKKTFTPENIFFYVTGSFSDEDLEYLSALISRVELSTSPKRENISPVPRGFGRREPSVFVKGSDYTMARFTFDLDMRALSSPEIDLIYDVLLSGYNSRLFIELSEKRGLFYDVNGAVERYLNIGTLNFSYELKERDLEEAVRLTLRILNQLKKTEVIEGECMKAGYVDNAEMLLDEPRELNFTFAYDNHIMNMGFASVKERKECYRGITAERLSQVAREVFRPENLTVTVKGNKKRINPEKIKAIILEELK